MSAVATLDLDEVVGGPETLAEIVADLAESLFPEAARPVSVPPRDLDVPVGSCIRITGGWEGEVVLRMPRRFAEGLAERLFLLAPGTVGENDVLDVLGELVNIVGGNVKAMLPGENHLSLPHPRLTDVAPLPDGLTSVVLWDAEPVQISMIPDPAPAGEGPVEGHQ